MDKMALILSYRINEVLGFCQGEKEHKNRKQDILFLYDYDDICFWFHQYSIMI